MKARELSEQKTYTTDEIDGELVLARLLAENNGPIFPSNIRVLVAIIEQLRAEIVR